MAVERFEGGRKNREIASELRVSERSVERWRRRWRERGEAGVSKGSPGRPRLSEAQIARLEWELERGPLVHGWADQRWTLARIKTLIGRLFHVSYTVEGTWQLLKRHGWSWQQPTRRAVERDDQVVEPVEEGDLAAGERAAAACNGWIVFEDEAGQSMTPPRARSWGRMGCTPVVRVRGRGVGRVSMAGMGCHKPGKRCRLFYSSASTGATRVSAGVTCATCRSGQYPARRPDCARLGQPAHAPGGTAAEVLCCPGRWLTVFQLPSHSPGLNLQKGIWSLVKRDLGNLAAARRAASACPAFS
jgi:transposase